MKIDELHKKLLKNSKYRKAEYKSQWDIIFMSSNTVSQIRLSKGLTQKKLAKLAKVKQSSVSRAETHGCQLSFLNTLAKAVDMKLKLEVIKADKLK